MNRNMKAIGIGALMAAFAGVTAHLTAKLAVKKVGRFAAELTNHFGNLTDIHTAILAEHLALTDKYEKLHHHYETVCDDYDALLDDYNELLDECDEIFADEDTESV